MSSSTTPAWATAFRSWRAGFVRAGLWWLLAVCGVVIMAVEPGPAPWWQYALLVLAVLMGSALMATAAGQRRRERTGS